jgi:methyltransferase of ATP-grasp peptide maturase system
MTDMKTERLALAERLVQGGVVVSPKWREAVEAVPRERFLHPGVFLYEEGWWRPVTALGSDPAEWAKIAYSDQSLTTQLDGHLTADEVAEPVKGVPTSSSTTPVTVLGMIESLDVEDGHQILEIGTGTGYSAALMCHRLGEDNVVTVEVDPEVAGRADTALEGVGISTWTVTGDGLLGHPRKAPYDRVIATCAVRRIPYTWVRQSKPGGIILSTVGSWGYGTGLAKVVVDEDGNARGSIIGESSFMQARAQAVMPVSGDLSARTAYADSERRTKVAPTILNEWMPAFLAQLAAPGAQFVRAATSGGNPLLYVFDPDRESFAEFSVNGDDGWTVRQGGPVPLWDDIEETLTAWEAAGRPGIETVQLRVSQESHLYWIEDSPALRWEHRLA